MADLNDVIRQIDHFLLGQLSEEEITNRSEKDATLINSYLVLSHAVIEEFIEDAFDRYFGWLIRGIGNNVVPRECAMFMMAFFSENKRELSAQMNPIAIANSSPRKWSALLERNHGIKEGNIRKLVSFLGIEWNDFEETLNAYISDLNLLGARRGSAGHTSPFSHVHLQIEMENAREWVNNASAAALECSKYLNDLMDVKKMRLGYLQMMGVCPG